jgi:tetratricopeptide (TPR) repeat protein
VRDVRLRTLGSYHPYTIHSLETLGLAYESAREPEKALDLFRQAAAGLEKLEFTHAEACMIIGSLCNCLEQREQFDQADVWRRKWLEAVKTRDGPHSAAYAEELAEQGENVLHARRHSHAEPILRECLAILQKKEPDAWMNFHAQSLLGDALLGQEKYADAEPVLTRGYEGLTAREGRIPSLYARYRVAEAGQRIVRLYEAWGKADEAAKWRKKLGERGSAAKPTHRP